HEVGGRACDDRSAVLDGGVPDLGRRALDRCGHQAAQLVQPCNRGFGLLSQSGYALALVEDPLIGLQHPHPKVDRLAQKLDEVDLDRGRGGVTVEEAHSSAWYHFPDGAESSARGQEASRRTTRWRARTSPSGPLGCRPPGRPSATAGPPPARRQPR